MNCIIVLNYYECHVIMNVNVNHPVLLDYALCIVHYALI